MTLHFHVTFTADYIRSKYKLMVRPTFTISYVMCSIIIDIASLSNYIVVINKEMLITL